MPRIVKWLLILAAGAILLLAGVAMALQTWVNSADFRGRVEREASAVLGVPLHLRGVAVDVWPLPAVALEGVEIQSKPPLTLERVEARPVWAALVAGRLEIATLIVRTAVLPAQAIASVAAGIQKARHTATAAATPSPPAAAMPAWLPRRTLLDDVTWVDAKGVSMTVDAQMHQGDDGLLENLTVKVLKGRLEGAQLHLERQGARWMFSAELGGGTIKGPVTFKPGAAGVASVLEGALDTADVEVSAITAPSRTLTGRLEAHTTFRSNFKEPGALADTLQSQTRFTVHNATVHGVDLAQAVKSAGMNRAGETRLDTLAGHVSTQGAAAQLTNLVANSGVLAANGNVAVAPNRSLSGHVSVALGTSALSGAVGVPLVVGGTLDEPSVTVSRSALVGAALGTMVAPGVGTAVGEKIGDKLGRLFGK